MNFKPSPPPSHEELFTHLNAAALILNPHGEVQFLNPAAERLLSLSSQAARNRPFKDLLPRAGELHRALDESLQQHRSIKIHETHTVLGNQTLTLQVELAPLGELDHPWGVLVLMEELSMAQSLQEEERRTDRLAMMGTLASGLAHEIRNPLGAIRAAAEMLSREIPEGVATEYSEIILAEVDRMNALITDLLDFAKPKKKKKSPLNINKILTEILILQQEICRQQHIHTQQEFDPSLPPVWGHGPSLKQAFLNIVKNAIEAMGQGGQLTLRTAFHRTPRILLGEGPSGAVAEVQIEDTGSGISKKDLSSLFTPFFTTKPQGTGLGLMMTQRILKEHQGTLQIESEPGKGTRFRIFLRLASLGGKD